MRCDLRVLLLALCFSGANRASLANPLEENLRLEVFLPDLHNHPRGAAAPALADAWPGLGASSIELSMFFHTVWRFYANKDIGRDDLVMLAARVYFLVIQEHKGLVWYFLRQQGWDPLTLTPWQGEMLLRSAEEQLLDNYEDRTGKQFINFVSEVNVKLFGEDRAFALGLHGPSLHVMKPLGRATRNLMPSCGDRLQK